MKLEINKDGIKLTVEGEAVTQEVISRVIEAVYGKPKATWTEKIPGLNGEQIEVTHK